MPFVNGKEAGFVNLTIFGHNLILDGALGIDYTYRRPKRIVYGPYGQPSYTLGGAFEYEGTLRLMRSQYDIISANLQQLGRDFIRSRTTLLVSYTPADQLAVTDLIDGVDFTEIRKSANVGDAYFTVELPFVALSITENYL